MLNPNSIPDLFLFVHARMPLLPVSGFWKSMTDKQLGMSSECKHILNAEEQIYVFS